MLAATAYWDQRVTQVYGNVGDFQYCSSYAIESANVIDLASGAFHYG